MADLGAGGGGGGHKAGPGVKKQKKANPRVDLTAMVDLAFLLITFFVFTTTMSSPTAMGLNLPKDDVKEDEMNKAKESGALTIMLGKDRNVYYYEGMLAADGSNFESTTFKQIREVIIDKKSRTDVEDLVIVIKPSPAATFKDVVDALDEMTINDVKRYALVDIADAEQQLVTATEGAPPAEVGAATPSAAAPEN